MSDDPYKTLTFLREALRVNAVETNKVRAQNERLENDLRRTRLELADARKEIARLAGVRQT
ncbi:hypothetical protein [Methylomagnum ishizawai]|uniref:hypothetical protein n=1 Tax=Methylomagnum ishizawai TaxID=1760988 RepID=UPI001C32FE7A|nr:hypothetical protein [Methylomagnum ishizawai]BBL73992.1 hypothetical protein MishRS11D_10900 [Methylomagnum ishizawai]